MSVLPPSAPGRPAKLLGGVALCVWLAAMAALGTGLMVDHWVGVRPVARASGAELYRVLGHAPAVGQWGLGHLLYSRCPCSRKIVSYLIERGAKKEVLEFVVLVDPMPGREEELRGAGYVVRVVHAEDLVRAGVDAAPAFVVIDGDQAVRHLGGYTARKQGLDRLDVLTLTHVQQGLAATALPVLGCAVSKTLQEILDPMGLKYDNEDG